MYKNAIPIAINSLREGSLQADLEQYLDYCKRGNISRVFLALLPGSYTNAFDQDIHSDKFATALRFFQESGLETGIWITSLGHGATLTHDSENTIRRPYQKITGVRGEAYEHGYCPLDENFTEDFLNSVRFLASSQPDFIMLDDDFRLNGRPYRYGCFCEKHLEEFYRLTGERIPRSEIEGKIYSSGKNKYRDAYFKMSRNTLVHFADQVQTAIHEVQSGIRVGCCCSPWVADYEGTDPIELAHAFAGDLKPYLRTFGAPYGSQGLITVIEIVRMQLSWIREADPNIEVFAEGDVYPRPRYHVPSKQLELYDLAVSCDHRADGILKYMFDYTYHVGYETGYIDRHIQLQELQAEARKLFEDKVSTGISVFHAMHKLQNWDLPEVPDETEYVRAWEVKSVCDITSKNSIATCHGESEYPVVVSSENAKYIPLDRLKNGAILDAKAADILRQRGVDVGLLSVERLLDVNGECYPEYSDTITGLEDCWFTHLHCRPNAEVLTTLLPSGAPGSYCYENPDGIRFMVFAADFQYTPCNINYYNNYHRQEQLIQGMEWVGRKRLPAVSKQHPLLYIMTAKNKSAMSVLLLNTFMDEIPNPVITLDKAYESIKFVNCTGELKGDRVYLSPMPS